MESNPHTATLKDVHSPDDASEKVRTAALKDVHSPDETPANVRKAVSKTVHSVMSVLSTSVLLRLFFLP